MTYKLYFANDAGNDSLKGTLFTSDGTETAKQIFNAGEDIECPSVNCYERFLRRDCSR